MHSCTTMTKMKNILNKESSPYLLQHASNPVHWQPYNEQSLHAAKATNKLMVVSIGYSACHWCHVMEHESFENEEVANVMNAHFINIKIDREERPDVDAAYMKAVQIMTGSGGWPLNVVCLPDGLPIWGGTYFTKNDWTNTLEQLQEMYQEQPQKIIEYAEKLHNGIKTISLIALTKNETEFTFDDKILDNFITKWTKSFDLDFGGMARSPKFMMPNNYAFLMSYACQFNNQNLLDFVDLTLTKMAYGGIFDTVGGGFSRYSVDEKWHVPHFEKMLYDNAQLLSLYSDAFKRTKNPLYKIVVEKTIDFVQKNLTNSDGGFFCALDADSLNNKSELEEGAFYVWTKPELQKLFAEDFDLFAIVFNINAFGHWEHGNYVLIQNESLQAIAIQNNISVDTLIQKKKKWEEILFSERKKRPQPRLDNKCLCSWNALMIVGLVDAYKAFENVNHLEMALKNAEFISKKMWSPDGFLYHNHTNGQSTVAGFLEDYAHFIAACISLFEVTCNEVWMQYAKQLTDFCLDNFHDKTSGFFAFNSNKSEVLLATHFETEDNVIPASNSIMANNLLYLGVVFENPFYEKIATDMIRQIIMNIDYPSAYSNWLLAYMKLSDKQKQIAVVGKNAVLEIMKIHAVYHPDYSIFGSAAASEIPFLKNKNIDKKTLFYVCENKTCGMPSEEFLN